MDRRCFLLRSLAGIIAAPLAAEAQQAGKVYRLGLLAPTTVISPSPTSPGVASFAVNALRELGYVEGKNLIVERRYTLGKMDRLPALARELVQLDLDVIVAVTADAVQAVRDATATTPIVMFTGWGTDPVGAGWVTSLAHPGRNVTGILISAEGTLASKRLELIKEAVPRVVRVALLNRDDQSLRNQVVEAHKAAASLGVKLVVTEVRRGDYSRAFSAMSAERPDALFVLASSVFYSDRAQIIELAAKYRLPAMYEWREQVQAGGLMAYGSSLSGLSGRVAAYVDRIFKGAKPADLPIEQPTKFELVINLKTAKALGLTIPPSLLLRADQVIE
jgi:putative ABC transport system substrate-binding protein